MSINKKKVATTATALALAGLMLFGGTYAWQSISQTALNEASDVINPGGRLHDDFNGENKDVYVENFTSLANNGVQVFARVRLDEYMEIGTNAGGLTADGTEKAPDNQEFYNIPTYYRQKV